MEASQTSSLMHRVVSGSEPGANSKRTCKNVLTALLSQRYQMMVFQQLKILTSYKITLYLTLQKSSTEMRSSLCTLSFSQKRTMSNRLTYLLSSILIP